MRASQFHLNTQKEAPAEAEVPSHKLMTRAGMIRKLAGGIYTYMPLGLRIIRKVEAIIRQEMNQAGAIELLMPVVQPAELWQESQRWDKYGPELMRIKDRHQRDFVIQPTSEEVITDIARNEIQSYRQLPKTFYHIQTKFRDERRPRFGLMRGREFTMKDAYSFDRDDVAAQSSYDAMFAGYMRIFKRLGLNFRAVSADTGSIGGTRSHEFQVIAETGEDVLAYSNTSDYAANIELAEALPSIHSRAPASQALQKIATPEMRSCEVVAQHLGLDLKQTVKSIVVVTELATDTQILLLLLRGDHSLNEIKVSRLPELANGWRLATEAEIQQNFNCVPGYLGPVGIKQTVKVIADRTVAHMNDFVCGANEQNYHLSGVNWGRDLAEPDMIADLRNVVAGDPSPDGQGELLLQRGIEVGHVFFLGTSYSEAMNCRYLNAQGKPQSMVMGCYGIGVSRLLGAAIEQNHDEKGMIWPSAMAPFEVVICPIGLNKSELVKSTVNQIYDSLLKQGIDVILDDRDERPGAMFADWELIGVPLRITVGERTLKDQQLEIYTRRLGTTELLEVSKLEGFIQAALQRS